MGIHELLGHGSGKLYYAGTDDAARLAAECRNPVDGGAISGPFYAEGATWDTTFGKIASPYEECRAECAGLYLSLEQKVLSIFGHGAQGADLHDVTYINWLLMGCPARVKLALTLSPRKGSPRLED